MTFAPGFGRVPHYDPRNEGWRIRAVMPFALGAPAARAPEARRSRYWNDTAWWGDQGDAPQCSAYALLHYLADGPVTRRANPVCEPAALYDEIRTVDQAEGRRFAHGATALAMAKAATRRGWIGEYRWGYTLDELVAAVLSGGPVLVGSRWYADMLTPDGAGWIRPGGRVLGGHLYLVNGVNIAGERFRLKNSWGRAWGKRGRALIGFADMERLIAEGGEVLLARELPASVADLTAAATREGAEHHNGGPAPVVTPTPATPAPATPDAPRPTPRPPTPTPRVPVDLEVAVQPPYVGVRLACGPVNGPPPSRDTLHAAPAITAPPYIGANLAQLAPGDRVWFGMLLYDAAGREAIAYGRAHLDPITRTLRTETPRQ